MSPYCPFASFGKFRSKDYIVRVVYLYYYCSGEQYFGGKKNELFLKNELFFKDPEDNKSRSTRPPTRYIYIGHAQTKGLAHGNISVSWSKLSPNSRPRYSENDVFLIRRINSWQAVVLTV